jgi:putative drug exporter of the RND superfamily
MEHLEEAGGRRAAHERLSTGALARWMRACASHPWRVVLAWLAIIAGLIVLAVTVGGGLKDKFEIPGSDTQKATDLIESEFASEQGAVLNLVFAARRSSRRPTTAPGSRASATRSATTRSLTAAASRTPRPSSIA